MLTHGATFVARGYSAKPNQLVDLIVKGINHKGFAFIHVQSPCTEFHNTYDFYDQRVADLPADWDRSNRDAAIKMAMATDKVHLGVFYQAERAVYETTAHGWAKAAEFDVEGYLAQFG
jgi:2-oxoglutarate ferredoxin oxidoreductase subunit beta